MKKSSIYLVRDTISRDNDSSVIIFVIDLHGDGCRGCCLYLKDECSIQFLAELTDSNSKDMSIPTCVYLSNMIYKLFNKGYNIAVKDYVHSDFSIYLMSYLYRKYHETNRGN